MQDFAMFKLQFNLFFNSTTNAPYFARASSVDHTRSEASHNTEGVK